MPACDNCEGHVTEQFARVFGDNEDAVDGCLQCRTKGELFGGDAAG